MPRHPNRPPGEETLHPERALDADRAGESEYDGGMDNDYWAAVFWSLAPTVVVLGLFIFVLRSILRSDRNERRVYQQVEAEERAKRGLGPVAGDEPAR